MLLLVSACSGGGGSSEGINPQEVSPAIPTNRALIAINADKAWMAGATGQGYKVAVIGSGIDCEHEAFGGRALCSEGYDYGDLDNGATDLNSQLIS